MDELECQFNEEIECLEEELNDLVNALRKNKRPSGNQS
jgi:hypothetical protein